MRLLCTDYPSYKQATTSMVAVDEGAYMWSPPALLFVDVARWRKIGTLGESTRLLFLICTSI